MAGTTAMAQDAVPPAPAPAAPPADPAAPPDAAIPAPPEGELAEVVVTARRESENLTRVPVSVAVIGGDTLLKQSITQATELSKLAPGLTLGGSVADSTSTAITLRGITWKPGSGTPATPIYFNEVPFDPYLTIQSLFDIQQVEVLRGPQGTTRGAPSISGAVTISTRRPDTDRFGGYAQGQYGEGGYTDFQGAVNVPVVRDLLAVRLAADVQDSRNDRVYSVNGDTDPKFRSRAYRATVRLTPTDTLSLEAMYQRRSNFVLNYTQVIGPGSPGAAGIPANFNGPALTLRDRRSVQDTPPASRNRVDLLTVNAQWEFKGHQLTYIMGRQFDRSGTLELSQDYANFLPGFEPLNLTQRSDAYFRTQEVRISSIPDGARPFDYDLGWFERRSRGPFAYVSPVYLAGAFGAPGTPPGTVTQPNARYVLVSTSDIRSAQTFNSFYGNVRFHLDDRTELSGGLSLLRDRIPSTVTIRTAAAAVVAIPRAQLGGLPCAGIPARPTGLVDSQYAGFCDRVIPAGANNANQAFVNRQSKALYNFSLSRQFTDDVLGYVTTGTSYRSGLPAVANNGLPAALLTPEPEDATSYEVGVKARLNRHARVTLDVFQIDYGNQLTQFAGVPYFNSVSGQVALTSPAFFRNIDARVRGIEGEVAARPFDRFTLAANASYTRITSRGGSVPCSNPTGPAITAANPINFCVSERGQVLNQQAPFQATVNGSYDVPVGDLNGYLRFNVNYQGRNPNFGNAQRSDGSFVATSDYAIVDLFAGITGLGNGWELGLFAKNVFDTQRELTRIPLLGNIYAPYAAAPTGYARVTTLLPRQIGVTARYAFGGR